MKYSCYQMNSNYDFPLHFHFFCEFCPVAGKAGYSCLSGIKKIIKGGINSIPIIIIFDCRHMSSHELHGQVYISCSNNGR